jgi:hypothetical protein
MWDIALVLRLAWQELGERSGAAMAVELQRKSGASAACLRNQDIQADKIVLPIADRLVLHGGVALGARLHLVEEVGDHLPNAKRGGGT